MKRFSTREAAKKLSITHAALAKYIRLGKVPTPDTVNVGKRVVHSWSEDEIERLRALLPKIANGRKTRYRKLREKQKAQAGVPVPQKRTKNPKKK
jgi:hypothetical protein